MIKQFATCWTELFVTVPQLKTIRLGENVAYATVFLHTCRLHTAIPKSAMLRRQLHSSLGDFNNGVCHVMKITIGKSYPRIKTVLVNKYVSDILGGNRGFTAVFPLNIGPICGHLLVLLLFCKWPL